MPRSDRATSAYNIRRSRTRYNAHEPARLERTKKRSTNSFRWVGAAFATGATARLVGHPFVVIFLELALNFTLAFGKRFVEVVARSSRS